MTPAYRLSPQLSFRTYPDFVVLLHHGTGKILRLNRSAGLVLESLERQEQSFTGEERAFINELKTHGIVVTEDDDGPSLPERTPDTTQEGEPVIIEELKTYSLKRLIPLSCQMELTHRCGLKCRHCYLSSEKPGRREELSLGEIETFLDELADLGGLFLVLTGGEPFFRPDFEEIFRYARKKRFAVSFLTSGWGVDLDCLAGMVESGIDAAQVSIHGPDSESHDAFTGVSGSFKAAWETLTTLKELGVQVRAAVCVHKKNLHLIDRIVSLLKGRGIRHNFNLNMLPKLNGDMAPRDLQLDEDQIKEIFESYPLRSAPRLAALRPEDPVCITGAAVVALDPYGSVYPCLMWRNPAGSVKNRDFTRIWRYSEVLAEARGLKFKDLEDCPSCRYRSSCNRCTGLAVMEGFKPKSHSLLDCSQARVLSSLRWKEQ